MKPGLVAAKPYTPRTGQLDALRNSTLHFYVGSGLSAASGLVGWGEMAKSVEEYRTSIEKLQPKRPIPTSAESLSTYFREFADEEVATTSGPVRRLSRQAIDLGDVWKENCLKRTRLLNCLLRYSTDQFWPGSEAGILVPFGEPDLALQRFLWRSSCTGILTPNYDTLIEQAYYTIVMRRSLLRVYRYTAEFLPFIQTNPRFVLKLHGDINDIRTMQFDPEAAWNPGGVFSVGNVRVDLTGVYSDILQNSSVVYVGAGMRDRTIIELHTAWRRRATTSAGLRVALIPTSEVNVIRDELQQRGVEKSLYDDIVFLSYDGNPNLAKTDSVRTFLEEIAQVRPNCLDLADDGETV
ncbi:MAG: SIR2 family protein [Planctomycetes bacterium]|nr:SIR2 family protein [Planctomycetota bacterium]